MSSQPKIQSLIDAKDMEGLIRALRYPADSEIRTQAAQGLAILHDVKAAESLIRSTLEDPDADVRKAASLALMDLLGSQTAQNALDAFSIDSADDLPWIGEQEQPATIVDTTGWRLEDIGGLIAVLTNEPNSDLKLKAIRALQDVHNTRALDVLTLTALWDEDDRVQQAAREALEGFFGDHLPAILEDYKLSEVDQEEGSRRAFDAFQTMEEHRSSPFRSQQQSKTDFTPTVQEDNPGRKFLILLAILAVIAAIVFFILTR